MATWSWFPVTCSSSLRLRALQMQHPSSYPVLELSTHVRRTSRLQTSTWDNWSSSRKSMPHSLRNSRLTSRSSMTAPSTSSYHLLRSWTSSQYFWSGHYGISRPWLINSLFSSMPCCIDCTRIARSISAMMILLTIHSLRISKTFWGISCLWLPHGHMEDHSTKNKEECLLNSSEASPKSLSSISSWYRLKARGEMSPSSLTSFMMWKDFNGHSSQRSLSTSSRCITITPTIWCFCQHQRYPRRSFCKICSHIP